MSYIGNQPYQVAFVTDTFSGNGSTTVFTMSVAPAGTSSVLVAITGVLQDPSTYSVSGTTLTFSAAPPSGTSNISVRYLGIPASGVTTTAYRTVTEFTATAGQTTFTPPSYTAGFINVYRNGALLGTADYTATNGTTVVLASAASSGDLVTVESFYVSSVLNAIPATAGSVGTTYLTDGGVTTAKIADANVTAAKLASGAARANFGSGAVLQVVQGTTSTQVSTASTSFTSTGLSATITPSSTSNKILVFVSQVFSISTDNHCWMQILRNSTQILRQDSTFFAQTAGISGGSLSFCTLDSPSSTSSITYSTTVATRDSGESVTANYQNVPATIILMEIAA